MQRFIPANLIFIRPNVKLRFFNKIRIKSELSRLCPRCQKHKDFFCHRIMPFKFIIVEIEDNCISHALTTTSFLPSTPAFSRRNMENKDPCRHQQRLDNGNRSCNQSCYNKSASDKRREHKQNNT